MEDHFAKQNKMSITLKYIDPTYMIRAIPSNASDNVYCTLLAQSAVHGVMAGYAGFTSGLVNGRQTYIPFSRIIEKQNKVVIFQSLSKYWGPNATNFLVNFSIVVKEWVVCFVMN